jgi:hypothetical protein
MSIENFPIPGVYNTRGGLAVYGPGTDGDVIITGTIVLNRDMYYNNLTVMGEAQLDTNGYRVFIKDTLNMADSSAVIGRLSDKTSVGSILGGAPPGIKASDTLGGNGGLNPGENFFGEAEFYNFSQAIAGYKFDAVAGTLKFLMGGSGGSSGSVGETGQSGSFTSGSPGEAGSLGSVGSRPGFESTVGVPGGRGYSGSPGSPGSDGVGGAGGAGGAGGIGGSGGGVVIISARNIIGSGIIRADGESGLAGSAGSPGSPGTPGTPGNSGSPGSPAPDFFQAAYNYVSSYAYYVTNNVSAYNAPTTNPTTYNTINYYPVQYAGATNPYISSTAYYLSGALLPGNAYYLAGAAIPGNTVPGNAIPGNINPGTLGPASVRYRAPTRNPTTYNRPTTNATTYGRPTLFYNSPSYSRPTLFYNEISGGNFYTYVSGGGNFGGGNPVPGNTNPGNIFYFYQTNFVPQVNSFQPSIFHTGGAGGAGGAGGSGGIGSAGLPGSPGTAGYAGGGGVVLVVTENDIPGNIDVRAAAGTGDGGMATSGTVIIIKNEAVEYGN